MYTIPTSANSTLGGFTLGDMTHLYTGFLKGNEPFNFTPIEPNQGQMALLNSVRFVVQKICLPLILAIGIPGNLFTLIVLSRRNMRTSSTNFYLSTLALADMFYLIFHFSLSAQHYPRIREERAYLRYLVYGYPLTDMFSNASVWIVVSFTTERFIVVKDPIKGKIWCTLKRAKWVVLSFFIISVLGTLPTYFERTVVTVTAATPSFPTFNTSTTSSYVTSPFIPTSQTSEYLTNIALSKVYFGKFVKTFTSRSPKTTMAATTTLKPKYIMADTQLYKDERYQKGYFWFTSVFFCFLPLTLLLIFNSLLIVWIRKSSATHRNLNSSIWLQKKGAYSMKTTNTNLPNSRTPSNYLQISRTNDNFKEKMGESRFKTSSVRLSTTNNIQVSPLVKNLRKLSVPAGRIVKSDGFLRTSNVVAQTQMITASYHQETRITYMLIIVVLVFMFCQLPSAILLLAFLLRPAKQELIIWRLMNNFANLLVAIHACLNFILYCLLSKKFRATFTSLFLPCFHKKPQRYRQNLGSNSYVVEPDGSSFRKDSNIKLVITGSNSTPRRTTPPLSNDKLNFKYNLNSPPKKLIVKPTMTTKKHFSNGLTEQKL